MSTIGELPQPLPPDLSPIYSRPHSSFPAPQSRRQSATMQAVHSVLSAGSFDGRSASFNGNGAPPQQVMYNNSQRGMMAQGSPYRSFPEMNGYAQPLENPQIYTAVYSGVQVYEMDVNGIAVMRRRSDSWLNATQILKVAGVDKGKRTKVLEKEILTGEHEKVQGGYGKYQGTWINYQRGREFCRQYGVEEILRPLLEYDMNADGTGAAGHGIETPTKEQAMAANRKRFYSAGLDNRQTQNASGTFFQNISSTASNAIAAMNKVARMNSPAPRPGSAQRRPVNPSGRPSQPPMQSQESFRSSQQSMPSQQSERSFGGPADSTFGSMQHEAAHDFQEPPRKRMRSSQDESIPQPNGDIIMREGTPTEPADSFMYTALPHMSMPDGNVPIALPPLPPASSERDQEKQALLTDLFADTNRTDYSSHPAIQRLSGSDLDIPIDNAGNTALHWAATLARVSLMRLLVSKGADIRRGNAAGQTPLMSAVQVNNSFDHTCFPETLEIFAPLIEYRDVQGRTILHHIAVTCAIKGRAHSSKYYLEALLEFLVRSNSQGNSQTNSFDAENTSKPIGLMRFMSEMVNARDKGGNTALNLAARIGNRSIIQQLLEVQADVTIPNYKGMRPIEFGVGTDIEKPGFPSINQISSPSKGKAPLSRVDETSREIMPLISSFLSQAESQFSAEARIKQDNIDRTNSIIRELSALQKSENQKLEALRQRIRTRNDRAQRIQNLRRWVDTQRRTLATTEPASLTQARNTKIGDVDVDSGVFISTDHLPHSALSELSSLPSSSSHDFVNSLPSNVDISSLSPGQKAFLSSLPPTRVLRARLEAYVKNNNAMSQRTKALKERDGELEAQYRKIVGLCTGVEEHHVDRMLPRLVAAIESESGDGMEMGRVKEFLRKLEVVDG